MKKINGNPLDYAPVGKLMIKFAVPSIIAMIVGALYNIVDQLFIGQAVGILGNGATNVAFPFSTACLSLGLLFGIGGASCFNLAMGRGEKDEAPYYMGNSYTMLVLGGLLICLIAVFFSTPLLKVFGATKDILPLAEDYVRITAIGFPFLMLTIGGGHLIRADGSPHMTMICNITGAVINTALDALFVLKFDWQMKGAALATVIGQVISAIIVVVYIFHCKSVKLRLTHFIVKLKYIKRVASVGMASFFNQIAMMIVQIVLNNSLKHYGKLSVYGPDIPIAIAGIGMKVSQVFFSIIIGIAQGSQPIQSFNYGAGKFDRVKQAYKCALVAGGVVSFVSFVAFQFFPRQIVGMFGDGTEEYFEFGVRFFRIFLMFMLVNFLQPVTTTFFTSIGKSIKGVFLSLTRQIIFLLPFLIILPIFVGVDGILYAGPIADGMALAVTLIMACKELRQMK